MNLREMRLFARSLVRDQQFIDAHFNRWLNLAYRELCSGLIIPKLHCGSQVDLVAVDDSTNQFYLPYDFQRVISFVDQSGRSLDPILNEDVRQFGEYNTFGSFVQFYEHAGANVTPLYDSYAETVTANISLDAKTVTASDSIFTDEHVGEWILPIDRNSASGSSNPEDYGYLISATSGTVTSPSTTCTIARPFRGVISDAGSVTGLTTGYFEIRPKNTPIIRIWGDPSSNGATISVEYQRVPSKLASDYDIPEEPRLCHAMIYEAIGMAGWAYQNAFTVKKAEQSIAQAVSSFQNSKDFDKQLLHNFITGNPNGRSNSMISGLHLGRTGAYGTGGIRY